MRRADVHAGAILSTVTGLGTWARLEAAMAVLAALIAMLAATLAQPAAICEGNALEDAVAVSRLILNLLTAGMFPPTK